MPLSPDKLPQVAILITSSTEWGRRILKGILSYANEVGPWHVWTQTHQPFTLKRFPKKWQGDGIIASVDTPELAAEINASGLPVINVADCKVEGFSAPCIRTDDATGTEMAAEHFIERGVTNLAYIGPNDMENPVWYGNAFEQALAKRGLPCSKFNIQCDDPNLHEKITPWLKKLPKPVGVLAWGHGFARIVVECCLEADIAVPHDVAVLSGSYDELFSHACFPALSGVLTPTEQIGYHAANKLHQLMNGKDVPHDTSFIAPCGIMERVSTDTFAVRDPQLKQVVEFIRNNAYEPINMEDITRAVPMARRSLERRFQQTFGRSPTDEIRRIRINRARRLLAETEMSMQEVADACGYATYNYLAYVFKQTTGCAPSNYRKQFRI